MINKLAKLNKKKSIQDIQDENFKTMSVDKKMQLTFSLNRLVRKIAESSIKEQYPKADNAFIKEKLREKMRL
ncbi:hypothetical protein HZB04_02485 [Candidatus Wolfebacteria bacterium]|nr:hypothetical protein [Candidatus Wolfebacteria bacterium]